MVPVEVEVVGAGAAVSGLMSFSTATTAFTSPAFVASASFAEPGKLDDIQLSSTGSIFASTAASFCTPVPD